ncbi:MAG: methyltransferase domain-containing protein [Pseudomonadota bacterium]
MSSLDSGSETALAEARALLGPLSRDALLGGRVLLWQPVSGYRAATDPVLLAAAVPARAGQSVLELGIGAGTASLCLGARAGQLDLTGLELEPGHAALARANATAAGRAIEVVQGSVAAMPPALKSRRFDHVILNPPWHGPGPDSATPALTRATREAGGVALDTWIAAAVARTTPRGHVTLIHRADRLDAILSALSGPCGDIRVLPLAPRVGRPAGRVIVRARTQVRTPLTLLAPLVLHEGDAHPADRDHFTGAARAVLHDAAPLAMGEECR